MGWFPHNNVFAWTPVDYKISDIFQRYAANFIKHKNPNAPGLPLWQPVNRPGKSKVLYIGSNTELKDEQHRERYLFLE